MIRAWMAQGKIAIVPNDFRESSVTCPRFTIRVHSGLRSEDNTVARLPTIVVDKFLDRLPFGSAESDGWIAEIDQACDLNIFWDLKDFLDFWLSPTRCGSVDGQAGRKAQRVGCQHKVLDGRIDTRIPDFLTRANTVQINAAIDYDRYFLSVTKHLSSLIINISHTRRHSRAAGEPRKPSLQHWFLETIFHLRVTNHHKFPWLSIASRGCFGRGLEDGFQFVLRDRVRLEFPD